MSKNAQRFQKKQKVSIDNVVAENEARNEHLGFTGQWDLEWFKPTEKQKEIGYKLDSEDVDIVLVNASAGCGKTSAAIHKALSDVRKGKFKSIRFVKTPAEYGDDQIGFLSGSKDEKMDKHFEVMRGVFYDFMPKTKLKTDESKGVIKFDIPNFLAGATLYDTLLIVDESQTISNETLKLVLERLGEGSKAIVLYDSKQCYASKKRTNGAKFLQDKVVKKDELGNITFVEDLFAYVEMTPTDNMRSRISKKITEIYN